MTELEARIMKFPSSKYNNIVPLKAISGHFATNHSHINYFIDLTTIKSRASEAKAVAREFAQQYMVDTVVDTIVCLDGTRVIGSFLADELTEAGVMCMNQHGTIYVISPEQVGENQCIFRDNLASMVKGKNCLLLMASATTGVSIEHGVECVEYYGGKVAGISSLFSNLDKIRVNGTLYKINTLFTPDDIPNYASYPRKDCPYCKKGIPIEALVNSFGYSKL